MAKKTFFQPFLTIGLLVTAIFVTLQILPVPWQKRSYSEKLTDAIFPRIAKEEASKMYGVLKIFDAVLGEQAIPYWMDGVTLLGAVRHGGIVPWEKGMELYIFQTDSEKLLALKSEFEKFGLELIPHKQGFHLKPKDSASMQLSVSLAVKDPVSRKIFMTSAGCSRFWKEQELLPLVHLPYGPITLLAPKNPLPHLMELYGKDIMEKAFDLRDFKTGQPLPTCQVRIEDFHSAECSLESEWVQIQGKKS